MIFVGVFCPRCQCEMDIRSGDFEPYIVEIVECRVCGFAARWLNGEYQSCDGSDGSGRSGNESFSPLGSRSDSNASRDRADRSS